MDIINDLKVVINLVGRAHQVPIDNLWFPLQVKNLMQNIQVTLHFNLGKFVGGFCRLLQILTLSFQVDLYAFANCGFRTGIGDISQDKGRDNNQDQADEGNFSSDGGIVKPVGHGRNGLHGLSQVKYTICLKDL